MKVLLVAINSQFVHTNPAILYLKAACSDICDVQTAEFTINEPINHIYSGIVSEKPDVVGFSCYIWNIELVYKLCEDLKKALPNVIIVTGGPEVSFENGGLLAGNKNVDYVISGEGEEKLPFLLKLLKNGEKPNKEEMSWLSSYSEISNLDKLRSPYVFVKKDSLKNRIAYIEASRGCPFRCSYCISSVTGGVRFFTLEKVFEAIDILAESGSRVIKFVDRTFNCNEKRALAIWEYILKKGNNSPVFHFEIDPGLLNDTMLDFLKKMPEGLVQMEAGIQSVHEKTLHAVQRPDNVGKALENLRKLISFGNIHVHADLIAGLPYETYEDFSHSFNRVYALFAHHFQLGFLKVLRGSRISHEAEPYGIVYRSYPPYEIICSRWISPAEILRLKDIEACLELFYNSGRFMLTMKVLYDSLGEPFSFYEKLSSHMRREGYLDRPVKALDLYMIMHDYIMREYPFMVHDITESLRYDYLSSMKNPTLPQFLIKNGKALKREKQMLISKYRDKLYIVLPRLKRKSLEEIWHEVYIDEFRFENSSKSRPNGMIAFDFGDVSPVTGLAKSYPLGDV